MIHLPWLTKVWNTLRILMVAFILFGLGIDIVTAFSLPNWVWIVFRFPVCALAVDVFVPAFRIFVYCLIRPRDYSDVCIHAVFRMCLVTAGLAVLSFVCSCLGTAIWGTMSFFCICLGSLVSFFTEISLSQHPTKWRQQRGPLYQNEDAEQITSHATPEPVASFKNTFICCVGEDEKLVQPLRDQLRPLEELGFIEVWDQTKIPLGFTMQDEIEHAIERAGVAIILISTNLLNSDYIREYQLPTLLHYAETRGTRIIPILARACFYEGTGLEDFQPFRLPGKRLKTLEEMSGWERNEYLSCLARVIFQQLDMIKQDSRDGGAYGSVDINEVLAQR